MKISSTEIHFNEEVFQVSQYDGSHDIDELVKDWKPCHRPDQIVILVKLPKRSPVNLLSSIIQTTPSTDTESRKQFNKYGGRYYTYDDIKRYDTAYRGYTVDCPSQRRKKCLRLEKYIELNGVLPEGWYVDKSGGDIC